MNQVLTVNDGSNVVIGCRPTSPDISVELEPVCIDSTKIIVFNLFEDDYCVINCSF